MPAKIPANAASRALFEVLAARGLTVSAVARAAAISEGTLRAYRDTEGRGLNTRTLHKVIAAIGRLSGSPAPPELAPPELSGGEIIFPAGASPAAGLAPPGLASPAAREYTAAELVAPSAPRIPVRGTAQGGPRGAFVLTGDDIDYVRCPPRLATAQGIYALFIEGDSMSPRYEPGELIFVSPRRPARIGDDVVILCRDGDGEQNAYIKRLLRRGGDEIIAGQFNPALEIRFLAGEIETIHLVLRMANLYGY
ncbi:MAG: S24 family peptidase [Alphaproteobacteria bacterium]|jgi:SOS-response transcriptional repressor LexA|nr:S24 family peptidase [Alphaproteobacteria bacterium]MDP6589490.1 S24 family peptidase [Alphaproteobacteria bacterium]MDP6818992.1 S24 family peptidase [Alphaproteobacteria bacterium]